jgi:hypothetical protein
MKRPDLVILIAVWEFLTVFGALIGIVAIAVFAFPGVAQEWGMDLAGGIFGLSVAILVLLCYLFIALVGGIGILIGKEWGRVFSIVHSALSLLWIPFGTIIGILIIIYLGKPQVKEFFVPPKTSKKQ